MDAPSANAIVVGELCIGDTHVPQHALDRICRTGGDGDQRNVPLRMGGWHVENQSRERTGDHRLGKLPPPLARLDDQGIGGVFGYVAQRKGAVHGGIAADDRVGGHGRRRRQAIRPRTLGPRSERRHRPGRDIDQHMRQWVDSVRSEDRAADRGLREPRRG